MSTSVQFRGREQVIKAYEAKKIAAWSMWQGSAMLHKCVPEALEDGLSELEEWLDMLGTSSNAVYKLKVYEDAAGGKINERTPCDGSFNFRLNAEEQVITNGQYWHGVSELKQEVAELKKQLAELSEDDDESEDGYSKLERIMGMPMVQAAVGKIFNLNTQSALGKIGGPGSEQQLADALNILKQADPLLSVHLWKLAQMATNNPSGFKFLLSTLDNM